MEPYHQEEATLHEVVKRAGKRVMHLSREGFETFIKKDRTPVTSADLEVDQILKETLLGAYPEDGWLSEETPDDSTRLNKKRVWILDPIDGTKYFMEGVPQFAISVALIEEHQPVVAVIYNPATEELFSAVIGLGATLNGKVMHVRSNPTDQITLLVSPPSFDRNTFRTLEPDARCQPMGSIAYTLALVAAGQADATINLGTQNEWDIAAGTLLVQEAGGITFDKNSNPIRFNQPNSSVAGIIATRSDKAEIIQKLVKTIKIPAAS